MHESQMYDRNCVVLLTYADSRFSLVHRDFQLFMKRLRKHFGVGVRFFMCGEYGEKYGRPHFHAALFNCDFPDKVYFKKSEAGSTLWTSAILTKLWGHGHATIGTLNFESAAYIARYVTKKLTGDGGDDREILNIVDPDTGEMWCRQKEYGEMSRKPGIGAPWFEKFHSDVQRVGKVVVRGVEARAPRYYDKLIRKRNAGRAFKIGLHRQRSVNLKAARDLAVRADVHEHVVKARLNLFPRGSSK